MSKFNYTGNELEIFKLARNWKAYYLKLAKGYVKEKDNILEVGAGIGSISRLFLDNIKCKSWTSLEPDKINFAKLQKLEKIYNINKKILNVYNGTVEDFETVVQYDIIILADVLEHIKDDRKILKKLTELLKKNGKIIIYVPAHNYLYSAFDKQIGHFRRYSKKTLLNIVPKECRVICLKFIDSIGLFASLANKMFLKNPNPTKYQIIFWDTFLVKLSRIFDIFFNYRFGKNIFLVLNKRN